ncbi:uncharacterized protein LOC121253393 [Juglans microcarpa x Juglans regia]|uniref:uncharacterized protein LOC121253393 n=1 Tax=Juglans microcarpa x Juglans regia TaxID=2249226 RepID=UPI001B7E9A00|nr:uncharacterized protein LOC121253393 [Juglans microcarpa x Juglans regia]
MASDTRLKSILPQSISPTQSAFVPSRMILDNVIVVFEALHSMSTKGKGQQGYMAVKLDMSKAYDRMKWIFLEKAMVKMGFNLSLLNHTEAVKNIHGFLICRGELNINYLFFADDSLLFCRANAMEWAILNRLLGLYENASGHKLNKSKISIFFSANRRKAPRDDILSIAGT